MLGKDAHLFSCHSANTPITLMVGHRSPFHFRCRRAWASLQAPCSGRHVIKPRQCPEKSDLEAESNFGQRSGWPISWSSMIPSCRPAVAGA